jgi:hypothetical protein
MLDLVIFDLDDPSALTEPAMAVFYDHFVSSRDMWILSGHSEDAREATEDWLYKQGVYYNRLLMRPAGDVREAADLKLRWLHDGTVPRERILCAYAHELPVINMYRAEGIPCFHVLS